MKNRTAELRFLEFLPFARRCAGRFIGKWPSKRDDLLAAVDGGLWDAILAHGEKTESELRPLIYVRVRGAILDELRRQDWFAGRTRVGEPIAVSVYEDMDVVSSDYEVDYDYLLDTVAGVKQARSLLGELSPKQRLVIEEMFFNDKTQDAIAKDIGVTPSNVSQLKSKAISTLRKYWKR